jgi:hypothetical protein
MCFMFRVTRYHHHHHHHHLLLHHHRHHHHQHQHHLHLLYYRWYYSADNLALHRPAFVKKHYRDNALAGLAVDGNADPDRFKSLSCAICDTVEHAWWAVDLGTTTHVGIVRLLARLQPKRKYCITYIFNN